MFQIGDYVVYGGDGVCRVEDIGCPPIDGVDQSTPFYFLKPLAYEGVIYTPVNANLPIRPALNEAEAVALINSLPDLPAQVNCSRDKKALAEHYAALMKPFTCEALAQTIKSLYEKRTVGTGRSHGLSASEDALLRKAELRFNEEIGVALGISPDSVTEHIRSVLESMGSTAPEWLAAGD